MSTIQRDEARDGNHRTTRAVRQRLAAGSEENLHQQNPHQQEVPARPGIAFTTCPYCNRGDLCPRRRVNFADWTMELIGFKSYTCNRCGHHTYAR